MAESKKQKPIVHLYKVKKGDITNPFTNKYQLPVWSRSRELLFMVSSADHQVTQFFCPSALITKVERGNRFDLITCKFGLAGKKNKIIVIHNQARRQIYTLKRGQYASISGFAKMFDTWVECKNDPNRKIKVKQWSYIAMDVVGHHVPKKIEIQKIDHDVDSGLEKKQIDELITEQEEYFDKLLNENLDNLQRAYPKPYQNAQYDETEETEENGEDILSMLMGSEEE